MTSTGWTWDHAYNHCDIPTYLALCRFWKASPPAHQQLRRIAMYLGVKPEQAASAVQTSAQQASPETTSFQEVAMAASQAGLPAFPGRPNDPMLDLLELETPPPSQG